MRFTIFKCLLASFSLSCAALTYARVETSLLFSDGMVLQRQLPVPIWGEADPGESVSVSFAGQDVKTKADASGKWMITLKPLKTSKTGRQLTIKGSNTITLNDVLVGEVWLCSGQSNMAGRFVSSKGRAIEPEAFNRDLTRFRFNTARGWMTLTEKTQSQLSMVSYYFGSQLYDELDTPIGLILRYHSGTPIQAWMPKEAAEVIRKQLKLPADWKDNHPMRNPGIQFEDKIDAIAPVAMRGTIWYQGERNAKAFTGWEYRELLPFFIKTWRTLWADRAGLPPRDFPFYYVQVPTQESPADGEWPWLRDSMRRTLNTTPNTGMAVTYDYGPSLHPENKRPAGERLALWALAKDYGHKKLVYSGPLLKAIKIKGDKAILSFDHVGGGLKNKSGGNKLKFFEIAGKDGKYVPAEAWIEGDTVVLRSKQVSKPVYARYLFRKDTPDPELSLVNAEGLPASSFITDDFMPPRP